MSSYADYGHLDWLEGTKLDDNITEAAALHHRAKEAEKALTVFSRYVDRWATAEGFTMKHKLRKRAARHLA